VIIGGAVVRNGDARSEFLIENETPVLRETDILSPKEVRTACDRIYLALQLMYVDPQNKERYEGMFLQLVGEVRQAAPSCSDLLQETVNLARAGRLYQALKKAQMLRERERELMNHVS